MYSQSDEPATQVGSELIRACSAEFIRLDGDVDIVHGVLGDKTVGSDNCDVATTVGRTMGSLESPLPDKESLT